MAFAFAPHTRVTKRTVLQSVTHVPTLSTDMLVIPLPIKMAGPTLLHLRSHNQLQAVRLLLKYSVLRGK